MCLEEFLIEDYIYRPCAFRADMIKEFGSTPTIEISTSDPKFSKKLMNRLIDRTRRLNTESEEDFKKIENNRIKNKGNELKAWRFFQCGNDYYYSSKQLEVEEEATTAVDAKKEEVPQQTVSMIANLTASSCNYIASTTRYITSTASTYNPLQYVSNPFSWYKRSAASDQKSEKETPTSQPEILSDKT